MKLRTIAGTFFANKKIDWAEVRSDFKKRAAEVKTDQEHLVLLAELMAQLKDGHAGVYPMEKGKGIKWPEQAAETGIAMFFAKVGDDFVIKNAWGSAERGGAVPGMIIRKIDGTDPSDWIEARIQKLSKYRSFSTRQQAFFYATHWGLRDVVGKEMELEVRGPDRRRKTLTLVHEKTSQTPQGPVFWPAARDKKWGSGRTW